MYLWQDDTGAVHEVHQGEGVRAGRRIHAGKANPTLGTVGTR